MIILYLALSIVGIILLSVKLKVHPFGMFLSALLPKKLEAEMFSITGWVGQSLSSAASIILITGAGGIFGKVLQDSGIAELLSKVLADIHLSIWLPFLLSAAIKTAQGSSTVALITTAFIMVPMMGTLEFVSPIEKAVVVIAIGAGSMVFSHANDSFFWVVTQLSGMDVKTPQGGAAQPRHVHPGDFSRCVFVLVSSGVCVEVKSCSF